MTQLLCPHLKITQITGPDYSSTDAKVRCTLRVSYSCTLPAWPGNSRKVCPRADGLYMDCPVRIAERGDGI